MSYSTRTAICHKPSAAEKVFGGSGIYHHILPYLSVKDAVRSYLGVNQHSWKQIKDHYLFRSIPRNKVMKGCLNGSDSQILRVLLHLIVISAYNMYSNAFARKSFPIEGESGIPMPIITNAMVEKILTDTSLEECAQLMEESVNEVNRRVALALRFWTSSSVYENRGIVDQVMNALNITTSALVANSSASSLAAKQDDLANEEIRINLVLMFNIGSLILLLYSSIVTMVVYWYRMIWKEYIWSLICFEKKIEFLNYQSQHLRFLWKYQRP